MEILFLRGILSPRVSGLWPVLLSYADNLLSVELLRSCEGWKVLGVPWLIPSNFTGLFQTTFAESITDGGVIYWHCWHFHGTPPPRTHHHRHLPVHPSLPLIPSINASKQAPGYRSPSSSTLHSCTPASLHPSVPLHHSQLKGAGWVALICTYEYARTSYPFAKQQVKWLPRLHALHRNDFVFGV